MGSKITNHGSLLSVVALALGIGAAACDGRDDRPMDDDMPMMDDMGGMEMDGRDGMQDMEGMQMDAGMMQRHADEADAMAAETRRHLEEMRAMQPEAQHERMGEHVGQVSGMLTLTNRQMREMDMGMGMDDEEMGAMMGMSGEEHRAMMDGVQSLRTDLEQLQTASVSEVRERMPPHLDRAEEMTGMMESSARHMRGM